MIKKVELTHFVQIALTTMDKSVPFTQNGPSMCWLNATSFALVNCCGLRNTLEELDPPAVGTRLFMLVRMIKEFETAFQQISADAGGNKKQIQAHLNEHRGPLPSDIVLCTAVSQI